MQPSLSIFRQSLKSSARISYHQLRWTSSSPSSSQVASEQVKADHVNTENKSLVRIRPRPTPDHSDLPGVFKYKPRASYEAQKFRDLPRWALKTLDAITNFVGRSPAHAAAITTTSYYYDCCSERDRIEVAFFYERLRMPPSFQSWFAITTLYVWIVTVRLRALPEDIGKDYMQQVTNHFFADAEWRLKGPWKVSSGTTVSDTLKMLFDQYRGACLTYDRAIIEGDTELAAGLWRNLLGAGWGDVEGVDPDGAPEVGKIPSIGINPYQDGVILALPEEEKKKKGYTNVTDADQPISETEEDTELRSNNEIAPLYAMFPKDVDLEFLPSLQLLVQFVRRELYRVSKVPDQYVRRLAPYDTIKPDQYPVAYLTEFTLIDPKIYGEE